jgi:hypothetical protein
MSLQRTGARIRPVRSCQAHFCESTPVIETSEPNFRKGSRSRMQTETLAAPKPWNQTDAAAFANSSCRRRRRTQTAWSASGIRAVPTSAGCNAKSPKRYLTRIPAMAMTIDWPTFVTRFSSRKGGRNRCLALGRRLGRGIVAGAPTQGSTFAPIGQRIV